MLFLSVLFLATGLSYCAPISICADHGEQYSNQSCSTFSEFASSLPSIAASVTNLRLVFLPGLHYLNSDVTFLNFSEVILEASEGNAQIECSSNCTCAKMLFMETRVVKIRNLTFSFCGGDFSLNTSYGYGIGASVASAISFKRVNRILFVHSTVLQVSAKGRFGLVVQHTKSATFKDSTITNGLLVVHSGIKIINANFAGSSDVSNNRVSAFHSNVTFIGLTNFTANTATYGGALLSYDSYVCFNGSVLFGSNSAAYGGAILAHSSNLTFHKAAIFRSNSATHGGAMELNNSTVNCNGQVIFTGNHAEENGGAIRTSGGLLNFSGENIFEENSALHGGAIHQHTAPEFEDAVAVFIFNGAADFVNNSAKYGGALEVYKCSFVFHGSALFAGNSAIVKGGALSSYRSNITFNGGVVFHENTAKLGGGIMADHSRVILNGNATFSDNAASLGGAVQTSESSLMLNAYDSCNESFAVFNFLNNSAKYGGALEIYQTELVCHGSTRFAGNLATNGGGALMPYDSNLTFSGDAIFQHNQASTGAAIMSNSNHISFNGNVTFQQNSASYGGAIQASDSSLLFNANATVCNFEVDSPAINFFNNSALYGGALEAYNSNVTFYGTTYFDSNSAVNMGGAVKPDYSKFIFSGNAVFTGNFAADGGALNSESSVVFLLGNISFLGSSVDYGGAVRAYNSNMTFSGNTLFKDWPSEEIFPDSCPPGFQLSPLNVTCICDAALPDDVQCDYMENKLKLPQGHEYWIGFSNTTKHGSGVMVHHHCPFDYCSSGTTNLTLPNGTQQCNFDRAGKLCTSCRPGFSLVLGNSRCLSCSNDRIALILLFAVAGILLVAFILIFNLTVAVGTINGLIFYANIVAANRAVLLPPGLNQFFVVFISWLNLDFGFESCFYHGMDAYQKTWLQFVFPLYIIFLVLLVIIGCHYSKTAGKLFSRGNFNPVATLTTLILLSYAKLLRVIIDSLSVTYLTYPDGETEMVWLRDANITYFSGKHIPLFIAAMAILLLGFVYTLILFTGQWLQAYSNLKLLKWVNSAKFKIFIDTYHAPYNFRHRYWTGMMLLVRVLLYLVFTMSFLNGSSNVNLLVICLALFILSILRVNIYKNPALGILENSFIVNLGLFSASCLYLKSVEAEDIFARKVLASISIGVVFASFIGILFYHANLHNSAVFKKIAEKINNLLECGFINREDLADIKCEDHNPVEREAERPKIVSTMVIDVRELAALEEAYTLDHE